MPRFLLSCCLSACAVAPPPVPAATPVPAALSAAHQAWTAGDLSTLSASVHEVLASDPAPQIAANAIALFEVAMQHHGHLPSAQVLPAGVRRVAVDHVHRVGPDGHRFRLVVAAVTETADLLTDLRVQGPGIDVDRNAATWTVTPEDGGYYVELELADQPTPLAEGLYTVELHLPLGAQVTQLWTVLSGHTASEVPEVSAPFPGQIVATARPELAFRAPPTPESGEHERVGVGLWVARVPGYTEAWSGWSEQEDGSVLVDASLADGRYWLAVSRREQRSLGPVQMGRIARRGVPFEVRVR